MAVRVARLLRARTHVIIPVVVHGLVILLLLSCTNAETADPTTDALLAFKNSLSNSDALACWVLQAMPPCSGDKPNWAGVLCSAGDVRGLRLENMGLKGSAATAALAGLPQLRTLSLMNNTLTGPVPDLRPLGRLRSVYLSYNHFSGEIPGDLFAGMRSLRKVVISNNEIEGKIPASLAELPRLEVFMADGNKLYGKIPDFGQLLSLKKINLSNNELEGPIPEGLSEMDSSSFSGNKNLCGPPLRSCSVSTTNIILYTTTLHEKYSQLLKIVLILLITVLIVAVLIASLIIARSRRKSFQVVLGRTSTPKGRKAGNTFAEPALEANNNPDGNRNPRKSGDLGKLSFLREDRKRFDLHDLLRASAEILGSGTFGASYKTTVLCDKLVVKRYKQMNGLGREEFHEHMRRLGGLSHVNFLPLVAYYYRKEEKLLVYDYVGNGSLAFHLHGNHNGDQPALDWPTRLRIVKGIANGLAYISSALPCLVVPHGHLKSSNIILDESLDPLMTDYGLLPAINLDHAQRLMMAYKSPEHAKLGRITKKTDVWSLGILILELLTGKFPENYLTEGYDPNADLATWVNEMIKERKTGQAFDADMGGAALRSSRGEMLKLLKIGLSCCEEDLERRLELSEAVEKIEELSNQGSREINTIDGEFYSGFVNKIGDQEDSYI